MSGLGVSGQPACGGPEACPGDGIRFARPHQEWNSPGPGIARQCSPHQDSHQQNGRDRTSHERGAQAPGSLEPGCLPSASHESDNPAPTGLGSASSSSARLSRAPFDEQVRQRFSRRAGDYEGEARLQRAVAWRLARLSAELPLPSGPRADLGAGTGLLSRALLQRMPALRQRPPLQLDLCPDLLAVNPLTCGPGSGMRHDGHAEPGHGHLDGIQGHPDPISGRGDRADGLGDAANALVWDLNAGLPDALQDAALLASSFALQWLEDPAGSLALWCRSLAPGGWLLLAVPSSGCFPQWREAAARAGVPCTALPLPDADDLLRAACSSDIRLLHGQRLRFSRQRQGGRSTLRHLQRLGASASRRRPLTAGQLRRLLRHWPEHSPLTWEVQLLIGQRRG